MKKFLPFLVLVFIVFPSASYAWDDCPFGLEDDAYPGDCARYIDTDGDGICDHSQPAPEDREISSNVETEVSSADTESYEDEYSVDISGQDMKLLSIEEIANLWEVDSEVLLSEIEAAYELTGDYTTRSVLNELREEYAFSPAQVKDIAESLSNGSLPSTSGSSKISVVNSPYNVVMPFSITLIIYIVWLYLTGTSLPKRYMIFTRPIFNMFWNTVLVLSAVPSVLFGFYLVFRYTFPVLREVKFDFLYWHVEGSIVFATVVVLHLLTRLRQYVAPLRMLGRKE